MTPRLWRWRTVALLIDTTVTLVLGACLGSAVTIGAIFASYEAFLNDTEISVVVPDVPAGAQASFEFDQGDSD